MAQLTNKLALVTGANSGMGMATVEAAARLWELSERMVGLKVT